MYQRRKHNGFDSKWDEILLSGLSSPQCISFLCHVPTRIAGCIVPLFYVDRGDETLGFKLWLCTVYCTREYIRGYKHKTYSNVEGAWEHWELGYVYLGMLIIRQTMDLG